MQDLEEIHDANLLALRTVLAAVTTDGNTTGSTTELLETAAIRMMSRSFLSAKLAFNGSQKRRKGTHLRLESAATLKSNLGCVRAGEFTVGMDFSNHLTEKRLTFMYLQITAVTLVFYKNFF